MDQSIQDATIRQQYVDMICNREVDVPAEIKLKETVLHILSIRDRNRTAEQLTTLGRFMQRFKIFKHVS